MNKKPVAGTIFIDQIGDEILIAGVHEWDEYYDLEVINKNTDESGHLRINKQQ